MKKIGVFMVLLCCAAFAVFAGGTTEGTNSDVLSLDAAIQRSAEEISGALSEGRRVAVLNFDSETPELSAYVMEELTSRMAQGRKLIMLDRRNIAYIEKELNFQMSGAVSDESAQSIGKMLGAESIAVGSLTKRGAGYSWRINVLGVESAVTEVPVMLDVRGGREYTALLADLKSSKKAAGNTAREIALTRAPETAADYFDRGLVFAIRGDFDVALLDFTEAVKLNPDMALAYLQRGKTYLARQAKITRINEDEDFDFDWTLSERDKTADDDRALADFAKAIALAPNLAAAWNYRGHLYLEIKENDKAIADYNQAITAVAINISNVI